MPAKLVTIGDSLSQGFTSGSIYKTEFSYPAIIARCLGAKNFRKPDFSGEGGLPINLENVLRLLFQRYGPKVNWTDVIPATLSVRSLLDRVEDYWERGEGNEPSTTGPLHDNLAVFSFLLDDCDTLTEELCRRYLPEPQDNFLGQIPEFPMYRAARRTLNPSFGSQYKNLSQIEAAQAIAKQEQGIENLIIWLGGNNCLGTVTSLDIKWSEKEDLDPARLAQKRNDPQQQTPNLWRPEHFQTVLERIGPKLDAIGANDIFIATVPHVTIPPISRGVTPGATGSKALSSDGYYEYYTQFWVWDDEFSKSPNQYSYLTREDARIIDATINAYNSQIKAEASKRGWHVVDMCQVLDKLAFRRQEGQVKYQFPPELVKAIQDNPKTKDRFTPQGELLLDTRFLSLSPDAPDPSQRYQGGIFGLDGFHPTFIGYGIIAYEFLQVMGQQVTAQSIDWKAIVAADTLLTNPPLNLANLQSTLGFLYHRTPLRELLKVMS
ncbi:hypothetical protein [Lyngbya aestuarii]|uniref:hypothetical protein n=1 Tax=Lyngbya aestuarii TaxID=118322 RepID=UPI00403E28BB